MTRPPVRQVATSKPVPSPLSRRARAEATSSPAPKPVARAVTLVKRPAPEPRRRAPPGPLAAKLPAPAVARKAPRTAPQAPAPQAGMALHTATGARKYLTAGERDAFLRQADVADRPVRTLCMTLAYAGCRLSEALALTADRVDLAAGVLTIESLKKRRTGIYRAVPVPPALLETLDMVHGIREAQSRRGKGRGVQLWPWCRMTGWRAVHAIMPAAGLDGAGLAQRTAARFRGGRRHRRHPAQPGAEMARPCPAQHHRHLRQCGWCRREGYRPAHVAMRSRCYKRRAWNRRNQNDGGVRIWNASRACYLTIKSFGRNYEMMGIQNYELDADDKRRMRRLSRRCI